MAKQNNVTLIAGTSKVDPILEMAVNKLLAYNPDLQFEGATRYDDMTNGFYIYEGVDKVGSLEYGNHEGKANSQGNCERAFAIGSPKVHKTRGIRSKIITTDMGAAIRQAKKLLSKPEPTDIARRIVDTVINRLGGVASNLKYEFYGLCRINTNELWYYIADKVNSGGDPSAIKLGDLPKGTFVHDEEKFLPAFHRYRITDDMFSHVNAPDSDIGAYAFRLRNGGLRVVTSKSHSGTDDGSLARSQIAKLYYRKYDKSGNATNQEYEVDITDYNTLEECPTWVREKVAALMIAEENYAIPNIGIRVQDDKDAMYFFLYREQVVADEKPQASGDENENPDAV